LIVDDCWSVIKDKISLKRGKEDQCRTEEDEEIREDHFGRGQEVIFILLLDNYPEKINKAQFSFQTHN
jgi:hypothetical protein